MRAKIELTEDQIKEAIQCFLDEHDVQVDDVNFTVTSKTDMRGESYGHEIKANIWVEL